jgi:hypothetical protein
MKDFIRFTVAFIYGVLVVFFITSAFAQEYQKVKVTVIVRNSPYGEYSTSQWVDEADVPKALELVNFTQEGIDKGKKDWETAEQYAKDHPAPVQTPTKSDYLALYNDRTADAQNYLSQYSSLASKEELAAVKADMESKIVAINDTIAAKPNVIEITNEDLING